MGKDGRVLGQSSGRGGLKYVEGEDTFSTCYCPVVLMFTVKQYDGCVAGGTKGGDECSQSGLEMQIAKSRTKL